MEESMSSNILGFKIFSDEKEKLIKIIKASSKIHIISGNPEVLMNGLNDELLLKNFTGNDALIIPDGVGTVIASKLIKQPVKQKIAGIEVMDEIIKFCEEENKGVYLLGAKEEVLSECKQKLKDKYPKLRIAGSHNGYFDMNHCDEIIQDIKNSEAYALFAAMGAPRQEKFIARFMYELPCSVFMGVGGSFDVFAGKVRRAPKWMINFGLEWLYRVAKEPWRFKRLASIPEFLWMVIKEKKK
jgi:N-acetylglucosaminyldiphosphoundecaprenol N-acetyl-beta-D-mannosaminyltransferase